MNTILKTLKYYLGFPGGSNGKNLPAMQETPVQSLCWEDSLEKQMANHSNNLAWKIPWTEEHGRLQSMGSQRIGHNLATKPPLPPCMDVKVEP